ncbi:zf-HC2 domain-containing protein [Streptosporangium sp. NPDC051022]|uniref:anti-sigma factor family protein n=1 Tax=Streptosporangium sp. NPDC051022 TaxID=3155752 RepID=UPI003438F50E
MTCDEVRMSLGAYVLGALEPEECVFVEAHLAECDDCRAEFEELTGVAGFLGRVSEEDVAQVASPPHAVLDRLLSARVKRRRITRVLLSLAASFLVVGLGGTVWTAMRPAQDAGTAMSAPVSAASGGSDSGYAFGTSQEAQVQAQKSVPSPASSEKPEARALQDAPGQHRTVTGRNQSIHATVTMTDGGGMTTVKVVLSGVAKGTPCKLDVIGAAGDRQTAANWVVDKAAYDRSGPFVGTTTIPFRNISRFEVTTAEGRVLVGVSAAPRATP